MADRRLRVADKRFRGWYYVDNVVLEKYAPAIGPAAGMVYSALCCIAGDSSACWAREKDLGHLAGGITTRSVRDKITVLELVQLVTVTEYFGPDGQDGHIFTLLTPRPAGPPPGWATTPRPKRERVTTTADPLDVLAHLDAPPENISAPRGKAFRPPRKQSPAPPEPVAALNQRKNKKHEEEDPWSPTQEDLDTVRQKLHELDTNGYLAPGRDLSPAEITAAESRDHLRRQLRKLRRRGLVATETESTQK